MAGVNKQRIGHDDIYEATEANPNHVVGGQLVVPTTTETVNAGVQGIQPAEDGAVDVLGVAARTALIEAEQNLTSTDANGYPVTYANPINELTTVYKNAVVEVVYVDTSANTTPGIPYGTKLAAGPNGTVRPWYAADPDGTGTEDADTDPRAIVGECRVVGGMGAAGGTGLAYIY